MGVKVFKFGGASVKDAPAIQNLAAILRDYPNEQIVVVISAMGKTTNALEKIVSAYYEQPEQVSSLLADLQQRHEEVARQLSSATTEPLSNCMKPLFEQLHHALEVKHSYNFDFDYDRIVCFGELLSTTLISNYLNLIGLPNSWTDARLLVRTDATFREGRVDWQVSGKQIRDRVQRDCSDNCRLMITQGFISGTAENLTTTLGREGSDYSASILAYSLEADSVTIWKDVDGLLNADPKRFPEAVKLDAIPYEEAIELAYYGASIIHPKTIKPLQNRQIPLYVKSFYHPRQQGSVITNCPLSTKIPSYIIKDHQILLTIFPRDFSFIAVDNLSEIFTILSKHRIKINLMQNSALSFSVCTDDVSKRVQACMDELNQRYRLKFNEDVELITIRHYTPQSLEKVAGHREILIKQTSRTTLQVVTFLQHS